MFDDLSYIGYTVLFCLPPLILLWLRREFFDVLVARLRPVLLSTFVITLYGSLIWPLALHVEAWAYGEERFTGVKLFAFVYVDDVIWWLFVSFLFASFVTLAAHYERSGIDIVAREMRGLLRSFRNAFRGFRIIPLERNTTIHVAVAVFVLLEALLFRVTSVEWIFVSIAIALVLGFELLNSALERIASRAASGRGEVHDPEIALVKDAAAAGVLVSAIGAGVVGAVIFLHRFVSVLF